MVISYYMCLCEDVVIPGQYDTKVSVSFPDFQLLNPRPTATNGCLHIAYGSKYIKVPANT